MAWKYNPFTDSLDQTGSGGASYINGVVADPTALPVTLGTPALDSVYLAKAGSGVWLINRKPAGLYCRIANNGVAADWAYLGAFPEVNADGNWELYNSTDPTKELKFDLSGLPTATVRTVQPPDGNGKMLVNTQPVQSNNGTLTASAPVLDLSQTWNNAAVTFTGIQFNITNTASVSAASGSKYFEIAVGGVPQIRFQRNFSTPYLYFGNTDTGVGAGSTALNIICNGGIAAQIGSGSSGIFVRSDAPYQWSSTTGFAAADLQLFRDAADTLAQRRTTNPQTFRLYNTYTDASNYERGFMRWSSNVLQIGTEKAGTGSARGLELLADGVAKITISSAGQLQLRSIDASNGHITAIDANTWSYTANGLTLRFGRDYGRSQSFFSADEFVFGTYSNVSVSQTGHVVLTRDADNTLAQRNSTNGQTFRIYNTWTNSTTFDRVNLRWASNEFIIDAEAGSGGGTLRGIKIGSATSSLLGFYGVTPVDQPATVADPAGGGTVDTEARTAINAIIDRLQELGLIA